MLDHSPYTLRAHSGGYGAAREGVLEHDMYYGPKSFEVGLVMRV